VCIVKVIIEASLGPFDEAPAGILVLKTMDERKCELDQTAV